MKRSAVLLVLLAFGTVCSWTQAPPPSAKNADQSFLLTVADIPAGYVLCAAPGGNVFVIGARGNEMVLLTVTPGGQILSADYLGVGDGSPVYPIGALLDSEGKVLLIGRHQTQPTARSFILRYDPALRKTLWARISEQDFFSPGSAVDLPAENAYLVCFSAFSLEVAKIHRQNGVILPGSVFGYRLDSLTFPRQIAFHQGDVFATGFHYERVSPQYYPGRLPFLFRASAINGTTIWAKSSPLAPINQEPLDIEATDLVVEDGAVYSLISGSLQGTKRQTYLQKSTLGGALLWLKKIEVLQPDAPPLTNLLSLSDGFLLCGYGTEGYVVKVNKDGLVQWAYQTLFPVEPVGERAAAVLQGNALYLTGRGLIGGAAHMFVLKIDLQGDVLSSCDRLGAASALSISETATSPRTPVLLVPNDPLFILPWPTAPPSPFTATAAVVCPKSNCVDTPDLSFSLDGATCNNGKPALTYTICNTGTAEVGGEVPVWFYPADPTQSNTLALGSALLSLAPPLAPGECRSGRLDGPGWLNPFSTQLVYAVINYDNSLPTPFSWSELPTTGIEECSYENNLSGLQPSWPTTPVLDLGPDIILCEKSSALLDAGADFITYLWQDGSTAQTYKATEPGLYYWVEVTDACGIRQRDSVFFSFSLLPDIRFGDTVICPGQAVAYALPGFNEYRWAPATGLSCSTCPEIVVRPTEPTVYTVWASDTLGCSLRDTFSVEFYSSALSVVCPPNFTVVAAPGAGGAVVNYGAPVAFTDCPCGDAVAVLTQGLPDGALFPLGLTTVCYSAEDGCRSSADCCFTVRVSALPGDEEPCDVKEAPCLRFEVLSVVQNTQKEKTYRLRLVNKCSAELVSIAYELPQGIIAKTPTNGATYTSPGGRKYSVRNPNASPRHSIRFSSIGPGIAQGQADIFEYTLPAQANPLYIHAVARLAPQTYVETHLNIFRCLPQPVQNATSEQATERNTSAEEMVWSVFPNPATDHLFIDVPIRPTQAMRVRVIDAWGRVVYDDHKATTDKRYRLSLPPHWPAGIYQVTIQTSGGAYLSTRFAK